MKSDGKLDVRIISLSERLRNANLLQKYGRPNEATPAKWNAEYKDFTAPLENGIAQAPKQIEAPVAADEEQAQAGSTIRAPQESQSLPPKEEGASKKRKRHDDETAEERAERKRKKKEKKEKRKLKKEDSDEASD